MQPSRTISSLKLDWVVLILQQCLWNSGMASTTLANSKLLMPKCFFFKTLPSISTSPLPLTVLFQATRRERFWKNKYFCFNQPQIEDETPSCRPVRVPLTPGVADWMRNSLECNRHRISTSPTQTPSVICFPFVPGLLIKGCLSLWSSVGG